MTGTKIETVVALTAAHQRPQACLPARNTPALSNLALANEMGAKEIFRVKE